MKKLLTLIATLFSMSAMAQNTVQGTYGIVRDTYTLVDRPKTFPTETGIRFISASPNYKPVAFISATDSILHVYDSLEAGRALMKQWEYNRKEREDMWQMLQDAIKQNQQLKKDIYDIGVLVRKIKP